MNTTIKYILLTALRDKLFIGLYIALIAAFGLASFLGDNALVEQLEMKIVYVSGISRIILHIGLIVFVCFHVRRMFESREVEVFLSRPISRTGFVIAYWLGFSVVALFLLLPLVLAMYALLPVNGLGLLWWSISVLCEALVVLAFALFAALILKSAVSSVLLCFGFYFVARMMGFFLYVLEGTGASDITNIGYISEKILFVIAMIMPRLDQYGISEWLIYGVDNAIQPIFLMQSIIIIPLLLGAAIYDFKRRQF